MIRMTIRQSNFFIVDMHEQIFLILKLCMPVGITDIVIRECESFPLHKRS